MADEQPLRTLKTKVASPSGDDEGNVPLMGIFAVGFALMSIFLFAPLFVPLGLILGIIALFIGQVGLGVVAILMCIIGIVTSPTIITLLSIGAFLGWLGV